MADMRPFGFRDYVRANGFHTVYILKTVHGSPVKIGISEDPVRRIAAIQASHFDELIFHRFWWVPGIAVATRIESGFKVCAAYAPLIFGLCSAVLLLERRSMSSPGSPGRGHCEAIAGWA